MRFDVIMKTGSLVQANYTFFLRNVPSDVAHEPLGPELLCKVVQGDMFIILDEAHAKFERRDLLLLHTSGFSGWAYENLVKLIS